MKIAPRYKGWYSIPEQVGPLAGPETLQLVQVHGSTGKAIKNDWSRRALPPPNNASSPQDLVFAKFFGLSFFL